MRLGIFKKITLHHSISLLIVHSLTHFILVHLFPLICRSLIFILDDNPLLYTQYSKIVTCVFNFHHVFSQQKYLLIYFLLLLFWYRSFYWFCPLWTMRFSSYIRKPFNSQDYINILPHFYHLRNRSLVYLEFISITYFNCIYWKVCLYSFEM